MVGFHIKTLIKVKIDYKKILHGQKEGSCYCKIGFPENMPQEKKEDIKNRLNNIIDDIRQYL